MTDFCVQIQPLRSPDLDLVAVGAACRAIAAAAHVSRFQENHGEDRGPYLNFMFATDRPGRLWRELREGLYRDPAFGARLAAASMTMCEGSRGWDDYLLLAHFDPAQPLDEPPAD